MNYSDNEPRVIVATGERVAVVGRGDDQLGSYIEIRHGDGRVRRIHASQIRPLNWREILAGAIQRRARKA